ncbi:MAG: DUF4396 domain-containing protein [Acidimicrobiales bacterium]
MGWVAIGVALVSAAWILWDLYGRGHRQQMGVMEAVWPVTALMQFVFFPNPHLRPDHAAYWFLMQIGMIIGFFTAWPANVWLIRRGIKEAM